MPVASAAAMKPPESCPGIALCALVAVGTTVPAVRGGAGGRGGEGRSVRGQARVRQRALGVLCRERFAFAAAMVVGLGHSRPVPKCRARVLLRPGRGAWYGRALNADCPAWAKADPEAVVSRTGADAPVAVAGSCEGCGTMSGVPRGQPFCAGGKGKRARSRLKGSDSLECCVLRLCRSQGD